MLRRLIFWGRLAVQAIVEHVRGITCCACGEHVSLPAPLGWRFETCFDGDARWRCGECRAADSDRDWDYR